jgi:hypothetical protein
MRAELDHLVVIAPTLAIGADFVARTLGVPLQPGGEHPRMGTHNLLLRLGAACYLEVIAIDAQAPHPGRPRWFGLDRLPPEARPRLATWVARVPSLAAVDARPAAALGNVEAMTRGSLRWRITIPADGTLVHDGLVPALIEWQSDVHPASSMSESGCSLVRLEAWHPQPDLLRAQLGQLGLGAALTVRALSAPGSPYLVAHIATPSGMRSLAM